MKLPVKDYIGDGVYVEFDGEGIKLSTTRYDDTWRTESLHWIYLDPGVMLALNNFCERMKAEMDTTPITQHSFEYNGPGLICLICKQHKDSTIHFITLEVFCNHRVDLITNVCTYCHKDEITIRKEDLNARS